MCVSHMCAGTQEARRGHQIQEVTHVKAPPNMLVLLLEPKTITKFPKQAPEFGDTDKHIGLSSVRQSEGRKGHLLHIWAHRKLVCPLPWLGSPNHNGECCVWLKGFQLRLSQAVCHRIRSVVVSPCLQDWLSRNSALWGVDVNRLHTGSVTASIFLSLQRRHFNLALSQAQWIAHKKANHNFLFWI